MDAFIRTILILVLIYYGLKFIIRLIAPIILKKMVNKMGDNFQNSFNTMNILNKIRLSDYKKKLISVKKS